ncbi:MAG: iron-only hydrogenase system regulator [Ruminococcaceae bacterium]|nr:iron-only hydrogenase system regulator [Oscillospiraceae bacterium]
MKTRVALISIIVENFESVEKLNSVLHDYGEHIIGRMGIPYHKRKINIISVALEAPTDVINSLTGKIGRIDGISAKTAFSNYDFENEV